MSNNTVLVMAGGTGGHVFPALAVAKQLQQKNFEVVWLGTKRGLESDLIPRENIKICYISIGGLRGKSKITLLLAPFKLIIALYQALRVVVKIKPVAVLGMGGFVTGPGGLAAWLLHVPLVIHEQNSISGLTNKLLSRLAVQVLEAFPGTFLGSKKVACVGNPVREDIVKIASPEQRFLARKGNLRLLVLGGSLGAVAINKVVPEAIALLDNNCRPQIRHQCGRNKLDETRTAYLNAKVDAQVSQFIDDMAEAYAWADLVLCRAGALTITELATVGVASVLVPYPFAVDDHQTANAGGLVNTGAAILIQQNELTAEKLKNIMLEFVQKNGDIERIKLRTMAIAARKLSLPNATLDVTMRCIELANGARR